MRAALRKGIKKVEVIEMDKPSPAADEVLIAVKSCGICGSDIVRVQEENPRWDEIVLGHEFAGQIVAVGENVDGWKVGDRATMELMTDFYRRLWGEKKDISTALWEAKMHLRGLKNRDGKPRYGVADWAAFTVSGAPER